MCPYVSLFSNMFLQIRRNGGAMGEEEKTDEPWMCPLAVLMLILIDYITNTDTHDSSHTITVTIAKT